MRKTTVIYLVNSSILGGGNKVLLDIAINLNRKIFYPYFICPSEGEFSNVLKEYSIPFELVDKAILHGRKSNIFFTIKKVIKWILKREPLILHINGLVSYHTLSFASWLCNIPTVCHLHFPIDSIEYIRWATKLPPSVIIPCNQYLAKEVEPLFRQVIPDVQIIPVSNAVDIDKYNLKDFDSYRFRKELGISTDKIIITIIGHISEVKGHKYFLEMLAELKDYYPNILGLIVGEDKSPNKEYRKRMEHYVKELGIKDYVKFLGFRRDIPQLLAITDIIVQPSLEEGLPLTVLEAMAAGKAIVTTPVGGVPEVIKDMETGLLVPVKDSKSLTKQVKFLLENVNKRLELGQNALKFVKENYSLERYVKKIEDIYLGLLKS